MLFVLNSLGAGGTEHSTAVLLPHLRDLGIECRLVILSRDPEGPHGPEGDEAAVRDQGFDVVVLQSTRYLDRVRELRRIIDDYRPEVVHTALFEADQIGRLATFRRPPRLVSSLVSTPYEPSRYADPDIRRWKLRAVELIDTLTGRLFVDRFHAVSDGVAQANARALRIPSAKISVVERGRSAADLGARSVERSQRVRASLAIDADAPVVLSVGRHEYAKAHDDLVRAIARVVPDAPGLVVLIAGRQGRTTNALRSLISDLELHDRVRLLGHRADVSDLMVAADLLVVSSRFEGTAGVALEAMALELPIVCTRLAGLQGILDDGENSILVDVGQPDAMARAIINMLRDPELAKNLSHRGREDFEARFTLDSSARRMHDLYTSCLVDS